MGTSAKTRSNNMGLLLLGTTSIGNYKDPLTKNGIIGSKPNKGFNEDKSQL